MNIYKIHTTDLASFNLIIDNEPLLQDLDNPYQGQKHWETSTLITETDLDGLITRNEVVNISIFNRTGKIIETITIDEGLDTEHQEFVTLGVGEFGETLYKIQSGYHIDIYSTVPLNIDSQYLVTPKYPQCKLSGFRM